MMNQSVPGKFDSPQSQLLRSKDEIGAVEGFSAFNRINSPNVEKYQQLSPLEQMLRNRNISLKGTI